MLTQTISNIINWGGGGGGGGGWGVEGWRSGWGWWEGRGQRDRVDRGGGEAVARRAPRLSSASE